MKKVLCILIVAVLMAAGGCSTHKDPMGEYAALSKKDDVKGITRLIKDLLRVKDYDNVGAVFNAMGKDKLYQTEYQFERIRNILSGREASVSMDAWSYFYSCAITSGFNSRLSMAGQLKQMRIYHDLLGKYFTGTRDPLAHAGDQQNMQLTGKEGEFQAQFGKQPGGKALVYAAPRYSQKEEKLKLGLTAVLPDNLLPATLEEVEYVVTLSYSTRRTGTYTNNGAAEKVLLEISVVQYPGGKVLKTYPAIEGSDPPKSISVAKGSTQGATGLDPDGAAMAPTLEEAFAYIAGLR